MIKHTSHLLQAYYDGELEGARLREVERHLETCEECTTELEQLESLSFLLAESPPADNISSASTFEAQVRMQLSDKPVAPAWQRVLGFGWRLAPAALLGAWVFVQSVLYLSNVLTRGLQFNLWGEEFAVLIPPLSGSSWLNSLLGLSDPMLSDLLSVFREMIGSGGPLGWGFTLNLLVSVLIGLLYWSWLASWWAYRRHQAHTTQGE